MISQQSVERLSNVEILRSRITSSLSARRIAAFRVLALGHFRCRENLQVKWIVPCHSVVQLTKHFMQNWSLGFPEDAVPKLAVVFKVVPGTVGTSYSLCQVITSVKISRGDVPVRRLESHRDKGQPQFRDIQDFFRREWLYDRTFKRAYNDCAFLLERKQRLADW